MLKKAEIEALVGTVLEGRYEITAVIGHGGMGVVYKGQHRLMNVPVAIKMILGPAGFEDVSRFKREAQAISLLKHPNIIFVRDFGIWQETHPYMVMDLVEGEGLDSALKKRGPWPAASAVPVFCQIADALGHAHKKGVLHRDLKPSNLMIVRDEDGNLNVFVLDFGLAKISSAAGAESAKLTQTGAVMGTPYYMSPEQCVGSAADTRSDIYAMGCIMYEVLTGRTVVKGDNYLQILHAHVGAQPPSFQEAHPAGNIPKVLETIVFKALNKDPEQRQQTFFELKTELLDFLADRSVAIQTEAIKHSADRATAASVPDRTVAAPQQDEYDPATYVARRWDKLVLCERSCADEVEDRLKSDLESARVKFGSNSKEVAEALFTYAIHLRDRGLHNEARYYGQKAFDVTAENYGRNSREMFRAHQDLGYICSQQGYPKDAVYHYQKGLSILERILTQPNIDMAFLHRYLHECFAHEEVRLFDRARAELRQAIEICERYCQPDDVKMLMIWLDTLGYEYHMLKAYDKAEVCYQKVYDYGKDAFGEVHVELIDPCIYLGRLLYEQEKYDEAAPWYRRAMNIAWKTLQADDLRLAKVAYDCGYFYYYGPEDCEKARKCAEKALEIQQSVLGSGCPESAEVLNLLGRIHYFLEDNVTAEKYHRRSCAVELNQTNLVWSLIDWAQALELCGEKDLAGQKFLLAAELARAKFDNEKRIRPIRTLAKFKHEQKHFKESVPLWQELLSYEIECYGENSAELSETLEMLVACSQELGDTKAAQRYREQKRALV